MIAWVLLLALAAGDRVAVEVVPDKATAYVHEPVRVTLRVLYDRDWFDAHAVQPFPRELDAPLQVDAPWMRALAGARITAPGLPTRGATVALNDAVVVFARGEERMIDGRPWAVLETTRTLLPEAPGELTLDAVRVRYVFATSFAENFIHGRIPIDPGKGLVAAAPAAISVRALPLEGRPENYSGAVGRFAVQADAEPREMEAGVAIRLVLRVSGDGNLADFDTPRLDGLARFHVYGALDDRATPVRTITYEIAPLDARVEEIPAIPFPSFDPHEPAAYRTVRTEPIPITVRPVPGGPGGPGVPGSPGPSPEPAREDRTPTLPIVATGAAIAALLLRYEFRRRRARRDRAQDPAAQFRARIAAPDPDHAAALVTYLAARLQCPPAAVIGPGLAERLRATGVSTVLANKAAELVERLTAARYGAKGATDGSAQEAGALVDALERARDA